MKLNRKQRTLKKRARLAGLPFVAPAPKTLPIEAPALTPMLEKETKSRLFYTKGDLNVIEAKRRYEQTGDVTPVDGQPLPAACDGWMTARPDDPTLYCAGVRVIRMNDGSSVKFYRVMVKPEVLKAKQKQAKRLMRKIEREDAAAVKRRVRLTLALIGKRCH